MRLTRLNYLILLGWLVLSLLLIRLVDIQVWQGKDLADQSQDNRLFAQTISPDRGLILDRYGQALTYNSANYVLLTQPDRLFSPQLPIASQSALARLATDSASIALQAKRLYPVGPPLSHVLGYVSKASADQLRDNDQLNPGDNLGQIGLEKLLDSQLQGQPGFVQFASTALGEKEKETVRLPAKPGQNVQTTLDPYLSTVAFAAMGDTTGAVVILAVPSGEVLALVSSPGFDPNVFAPVVTPEEKTQQAQRLQTMFQDKRQVFLNRASSGLYPPGSVFKLVTALAGLESGAFDQNTNVVDEGVIKVGEFSYANWYFSQYGRTEGAISLVKAITRSNDIFFYKAAEWTGVDKLAAFAKIIGYGAKTGLEIGGEADGLVPDPAWKQSQRQEPWYLGNTYHLGIGQGDLQVTLLQVANVLQTVYNHGVRCHPHLLLSQKANCETLPIDTKNLDLVLTGMMGACSPGGTAYPFFDLNAKRDSKASLADQLRSGAVVCKTGTAEFGVEEGGRRRTHGLFIVGLDTAPLLTATTSSQSSAEVTAWSNPEKLKLASDSGTINPDFLDWARWRSQLSVAPLPSGIVIAVLTESDDQVKYREGSRDAAPIARAIIDWIKTGATPGVSQSR